MEKINKKQTVTSKVYNLEKINPFFSKVKIFVMYDGFNRKGSYLSREAISKAIPTIYNLPIVGDFLVEEKNFSGHGASVVKNNKGEYELILSTRPYGTIPESAQIYWELVTDESGVEREYLVIDGAYLWTGRYPELNTILDEGYYNQSMEIEIFNAKQSFIEGQEVLDIQDFVFTGFCLLGIDKDSDMYGHVEPAFEGGKVVAYSLDKESFTSQFNQMMDELTFSLKEGGNNQMEKTKQSVEGTNAQEELKQRLGVATDGVEPVVTEPAVGTLAVEPETTEPVTTVVEPVQEAPQATQVAVEPVTETTVTEDVTTAEDGAVSVTEGTADGDGVTADGGATFSVTEEEYNTLKANFEAMETKLNELNVYKRTRELSDLTERFSNQVSEAEMNSLFEANADADVEKLEVEIFALIGKKNFSLETKTKQNKVTVVSPKATSEQSQSPYGDIEFIN